MKDRPEIICFCGSTRFVDLTAVLMWECEKLGIIALGCHLLPSWYETKGDHVAEQEGVAKILDRLHFEKIKLADRLFVVNNNGYIGEQTQREITFAKTLEKPISYLEPVGELSQQK